MAIQSIAQLKQWYKTGLKPLQQQFWDWLDSFRHKNDKITPSDLSDDLLSTINNAATATNQIALAAGTATFNVPANLMIAAIVFDDASNPAGITIGTSYANDNVGGGDCLRGRLVATVYYLEKTNTTLYFGGITPNTLITIYKA